MIETLFNILDSTKIIEESMPKIIEAFVIFYGEEERSYIESKFKDMLVIGYGLPDDLSNIVDKLKSEISNKLINEFFNQLNLNNENDTLRKIFFSSFTLDYKDFNPIQYYIEYLKKDVKDFDYQDCKQNALKFLNSINPKVNINNMDALIKEGAFNDIDRMIPIYEEIIKEYEKEIKKLEQYINELTVTRKLRNELETNYWIELLNSCKNIFTEEEMLMAKKEMLENFNLFSKEVIKVKTFIGDSIYSTPIIEAFSEECDNDLKTGAYWKKENIKEDRIKFFKQMGINLGDDYAAYENNPECKKIIPSKSIIKTIANKRKEFLELMHNDFYKSTIEYKTCKEKISKYKLLIEDDGLGPNAYFNKRTCMCPNLIRKNNHIGNFYLVLINISMHNYIDSQLIHELNHVLETTLISLCEDGCEFISGWDKVELILNEEETIVESLDENKAKRKYELFNETINEMISQEITQIMHGKGNYVINTKDTAKIKGKSSYECTFFLIKEFYNTYKTEILRSRKNGDIHIIFDAVGKENFEKLNDVFNEFYDNFGGVIYYNLIDDLNNNRETKLTRKYKELCIKKDEILKLMMEFNSNKKRKNV